MIIMVLVIVLFSRNMGYYYLILALSMLTFWVMYPWYIKNFINKISMTFFHELEK